MNISEHIETRIRISANEALKKILASFFPESHICKVKIKKEPRGAFPFEHMPTFHRHLKKCEIIQARADMRVWLADNFNANSDVPEVECLFAQLQVKRLLDALDK